MKIPQPLYELHLKSSTEEVSFINGVESWEEFYLGVGGFVLLAAVSAGGLIASWQKRND